MVYDVVNYWNNNTCIYTRMCNKLVLHYDGFRTDLRHRCILTTLEWKWKCFLDLVSPWVILSWLQGTAGYTFATVYRTTFTSINPYAVVVAQSHPKSTDFKGHIGAIHEIIFDSIQYLSTRVFLIYYCWFRQL